MLKRSFESVSTMLKGRLRGSSSDAGDLFANEKSLDVNKFEVYRRDDEDGLLPPHVIFAKPSEIEDLFATISTYHSVSSPITAFSHVVDPCDRPLLRGSGKVPRQKNDNDLGVLVKALLGASTGEALLASTGSSESSVTYAACRRSLSFALARSIAVYKSLNRIEVVSERWTSLWRMSSLGEPRHLSDALLFLCKLFEGHDSSEEKGSLGQDKPMLFLAGTLSGNSESSAEFRRALESIFPGIDTQLSELKGSFDGRLSAFVEIASKIAKSSENQALKDVSVAYVCNQIFPGSFSHSGVLQKTIEKFPAALVWYGAFAACAEGSSQNKNRAVLDKLRRDCSESFSFENRPQCDISFAELEVLARVGLRSDALRPTQQRTLLVELLPGVNVYVNKLEEGRPSEGAPVERRNSHSVQEAVRLLEQAARLLSGNDAGSAFSDSNFRKRRNT